MTSNVCFALLDAPVIHGRAEEPALGSMSHARLLEEAAALGGILRHLGAVRSTTVVIDLEDDHDAVVAALAVARIGAVVSREDHPDAPVVVVSPGSAVSGEGRHRLVRGGEVAEPDLAWDTMLRAGRTDPAACEVLTAEAAYSSRSRVGEVIERLSALRSPYDAAQLRRLLEV